MFPRLFAAKRTDAIWDFNSSIGNYKSAPNILLPKHSIKYMYKAEDEK